MGVPCRTWSPLRLIKAGTRTHANPDGDGSDPLEVAANLELKFMLSICKALISSNRFFSVENPELSLIWKHPLFVQFLHDYGPGGRYCKGSPVFLVSFDQCQYGLTSPDREEVWKKPTVVCTNIPRFQKLHLRCPGTHTHVPVQGSMRFKGKRYNRSQLAGRYPLRLCRSMARLASADLSHA